jgi:hypothetical protein
MTLGQFLNRCRNRVQAIGDLFSRSTATTKPATQRVGSQRMCPFCHLITPRSGRCCLECGKAFGNV